MPMTKRDLTSAEIDTFIKDNRWGSLSFTGDDPYTIPIAYRYLKGDVLIGLTSTGRKMDYISVNRNVCFMICKPRWETPDDKESCTSVIIEGELEEVTDRSSYGLGPLPEAFKGMFVRINQKKVGTRKCTTVPCEILAAKEMES
jgi:nitroimidazol reductase NimA-like FMN-containing flavoprotein (pyridoxamine 5'-phosphate oxidase superfamily)